MLLRAYTKELVEGQENLSDILLYDRAGERKPFFAMVSELRSKRFNAVVVSYPTFRLALLMFLTGIPIRVGTGYRWYSFLFNKRVYEHRKTAEKHELEYNLSLLKALGCAYQTVPQPVLQISANEEERARAVVKDLGISEDERIAMLHPGSGGSARDWKPENFGALAKVLVRNGFRVIVTGIATEEHLVQKVVAWSEKTAIPLIGRLSLKELAALLRLGDVFVSNSTGPLHIAAAVDTPVVGLYPPIRQCSPQRWGPWTEKKIVFVADNKVCARCQGTECQGDTCMDQITVAQVAEAVQQLVSTFRKKKDAGVNV